MYWALILIGFGLQLLGQRGAASSNIFVGADGVRIKAAYRAWYIDVPNHGRSALMTERAAYVNGRVVRKSPAIAHARRPRLRPP